jgi:hypothetical protein
MTIYSNEALIEELKQFTHSLSQAEFKALAQWLDAKASMIYAAGYQDGINEPLDGAADVAEQGDKCFEP